MLLSFTACLTIRVLAVLRKSGLLKKSYMNEWMEGWIEEMGGWMEEERDGWIDGWMGGWRDGEM